jgi:hypothetical protein
MPGLIVHGLCGRHKFRSHTHAYHRRKLALGNV